jgi:hypothetical protein
MYPQPTNAELAATKALDFYRLWHWISGRCCICGQLGVKPGAPEVFSRVAPLSALPILSMDDAGRCHHCAAAMDR